MTHPGGTRSKPVIGIAGGIGAGKSSVARLFGSMGAAVIDSDKLAHEELAEPEVTAVLRQWWGERVFGPRGRVDPKAIASIVFDDPAELARLEGLIYPRLARRREGLMRGYQSDPRIRAIVLDAPKLYEAGLDRLCDAVVFVEADRAVRLRRMHSARGWGEEELTRRENLQNALDNKRRNADYVVSNHADIEDLRPQVERVLSSVLASFSRSSA